MFAKTILLSALAATSLAAPAIKSRQAGFKWTVSGLTVDDTTDGGQCHYHYFIDEDASNTDSPVYECSYTIAGDRTTTYENQPCDGSTQFSINQGYDDSGSPPFITVVVSDVAAGNWAFFGWNFIELNETPVPDKTSPSDPIGTFPSNDVAQKFKANAKNANSPVLKAATSKDAVKASK